MELPLLTRIAESLGADLRHELTLAASGSSGCRAHRAEAQRIRAEQLRLETGCTARGWRGPLR